MGWVHLGGILIGFNSEIWEGKFPLSLRLKNKVDHSELVIMSIHEPNSGHHRSDFQEELRDINRTWNLSWVLGDDFNIVRFRKRDRSDNSHDRKSFNNLIQG